MVRWLTFILLTALAAAALPGRVSMSCDTTLASMMGCGDLADSATTPSEAASVCCSSAPEPPASSGEDHAQPGPDLSGCPMCAVICRELCTQSSPWGVLGIGLGTDGLAHAMPTTVLLDEPEWLPREASTRLDDRAIDGASLTLDRPRRQARLCVWTT